MFICYQYNCMELVEDRQFPTLLPDAGIDGSGFERCFSHLVEGEGSFSVACGKSFMRKLVEYIRGKYIFVKAAGGIVSDAEGRMLLMRRNDRWDLPKGKVEHGETLAQAALRETGEETGLANATLGQLRLKTYHIYNLYGGWHFKQTTWFDMTQLPDDDVEGGSTAAKLVPQTEEGITELGWFEREQWRKMLDESYATMRIITHQLFEK